jgi:L-malate glycosyltransferase
MRIALVAASPHIVGGQSVQAQALVEGLRQAGYDVGFAPIDPTFPKNLRWVRKWPYVRTLLNQTLYLPSLLRLRHTDIVHVFSASYWSFVLSVVPALVAARAFRKRIVLHYHSGEAEDHLANWGVLVHPWLRLADAIVVPSEYLREVFARYGLRACVVPNVVNITRFQCPERAVLKPRLLSARNLDPWYRVDNTLEAFALVKRRFAEATLTIVGDGRERDRLRRMAEAMQLDGIRFVGQVRTEDMPALYRDADIFVNSSEVDNQPVSVLEAFAAGLPVISTATGDLATLVRDGETGLIVPAGNPHAMAVAVSTLLDHQEFARSLTRHAQRLVQEFSWSVVRDQWAVVYAGGTT